MSAAPSSRRKPTGNDRWLTLVMLVCAVVGLGGGWWAGRKPRQGYAPDRPRQLADFTLTDRSGRAVSRAELAGQFLVVNFVFTSCSVSCQQVSRHMAEVQRLTAAQPDVRLVSFSVDPRTDTPEVLAQFGRRFGADTNRWLLLTGDKPALYAVIEGSFLNRGGEDAPADMPGNFTHADRIAVVDRTGRLRAFFDGMSSRTPADIAAFLDRLRTEDPQP